MRKRIVFLEQQSWLGGAQRVLEATLAAVRDDYDSVVAFPDDGPFRSFIEEGTLATLDLPIGNYRSGRKSIVEMIHFACRSLFCGFKLAWFIRKHHMDLVYVNGPRVLPAGVIAAWLTGRPVIFHLHLILKRRIEVLLVSVFAYRVSRIFACCRAAAAALESDRRLVEKVEVLYNPLQDSSAIVGERHSREKRVPQIVTIGMFGRITEMKGQHLLLQAVGRLPPALRERIRLLFVGCAAPGSDADEVYAKRLRLETARHGLDEQVTWAGYQAAPGTCYSRIDVLVHPALVEAMGMVILEAIACGIPVIAARTGGIPEIIEDGVNGFLVPVETDGALSRCLELFLTDEEVRKRLQAGARRGLDRRFSMETFSAKVRDALNQTIPSSHTLERV